MIRWIRRFGTAVFTAPLLLWGAPDGAAGQSLHLAELFAEQGRLDDARAEVMAWFEIRGSEASPEELQHGLWLRGRFAPDPAEGARDLEDLVTRYPAGPFTDRALAWMAAWAADRTDTRRAVELYTRLLTDFPDSDRTPAARDWLRGRGFPVPDVPREPAPAARAVRAAADTAPPADAAPASDTTAAEAPPVAASPAPSEPEPMDSAAVVPESASVIDTVPVREGPPADSAGIEPAPADSAVARERRPAADTVPVPDVAPPPADTAAPMLERADTAVEAPTVTPEPESDPEPAPPPVERIPHGPPVPGAAEGGRWAVQIGAFRNPDGAAGLVRDMVEAGLDARLVQVPLNDLLRVRVGRFATSEEAMAALERVRTAGWDGAVVADAREETVVRR